MDHADVLDGQRALTGFAKENKAAKEKIKKLDNRFKAVHASVKGHYDAARPHSRIQPRPPFLLGIVDLPLQGYTPTITMCGTDGMPEDSVRTLEALAGQMVRVARAGAVLAEVRAGASHSRHQLACTCQG